MIDDTAVTPQYVHGIAAERELPIIKRIAIGSLRNKLLFILPAALLLSQFVPWLLTPILMLGATYLCYEGAEKVWGLHHAATTRTPRPSPSRARTPRSTWSTGAIRTDFILSAEIMVIALKEVADEAFLPRLIILVIVAVVITAVVYGVVAVIVKMDDVGLSLTQRSSTVRAAVGRGLVAGMPKLLAGLSVIGTAAMLWVGGHILLVGFDELGWHAPVRRGPRLEEAVARRRRRRAACWPGWSTPLRRR